jgi:hypothetical protein
MIGADRQGHTAGQDDVCVLRYATAQLREIAVAVDRASAVFDPAIELVEASYSIHQALVLLADWRASREGIGRLPPLTATTWGPWSQRASQP